MQKLLPLQFPGLSLLTKGNQVSLVRIHFSQPELDGKSSDIGVGGQIRVLRTGGITSQIGLYWKRGKHPHPRTFSLTKKMARFLSGPVRDTPPYRAITF